MRNLALSLIILFSVLTFAHSQESLLIGSGDLLHIQIFDTPEFDQHARVNDQGSISLAFGGEVHVAGLAPTVAARTIEDALIVHGILLHPHATVAVEEYVTAKVSISGEVHVPGMYSILTPRDLLDVLAMAGGLTEVAARQIVIKHRESGTEQLYFVSNDPTKAVDHSPPVNPGDTIFVPKAGIVYAVGDFGRPGGYVMTNDQAAISVLELVARAGGIPPSGVPSQARLIRKDKESGYSVLSVPLSAMEKGKHSDIQLQPDDIVYIPFSYLRNLAMNASNIAASVGSAALYRY